MACERPGQGEVVDVVTGGFRQRSRLSPACHAAVDQPRIARERDVRAEAESLHGAGPEAFDQSVGLDESSSSARRRVLHVDLHGRAAAQQVESRRLSVPSPLGTVRSIRMTAAPRSANSIAAWRRPDPRELDNAKAGQRSHRSALSGSTFPVFHWPRDRYSGKDQANRENEYNVVNKDILFRPGAGDRDVLGQRRSLFHSRSARRREIAGVSERMIDPRLRRALSTSEF